MAPLQHFRSALNGFNRQDVVNYIEYLNNQHSAQIEQLNTQLQTALSNAAPAQDEDLRAQLDAALARCAELEQQLSSPDAPSDCKDQELEAYRRAERAERLARDRAQQIYTQANAALADATSKAEAAADQIGTQLQTCQDTLLAVKENFQQTVAALYAIRPEEE